LTESQPGGREILSKPEKKRLYKKNASMLSWILSLILEAAYRRTHIYIFWQINYYEITKTELFANMSCKTLVLYKLRFKGQLNLLPRNL
jgi:hypothetical protein